MKTKKSYLTLGMVFLLLLMMGILTGKVSVKAEAVDWLIPEKCSLTVMDSEGNSISSNSIPAGSTLTWNICVKKENVSKLKGEGKLYLDRKFTTDVSGSIKELEPILMRINTSVLNRDEDGNAFVSFQYVLPEKYGVNGVYYIRRIKVGKLKTFRDFNYSEEEGDNQPEGKYYEDDRILKGLDAEVTGLEYIAPGEGIDLTRVYIDPSTKKIGRGERVKIHVPVKTNESGLARIRLTLRNPDSTSEPAGCDWIEEENLDLDEDGYYTAEFIPTNYRGVSEFDVSVGSVEIVDNCGNYMCVSPFYYELVEEGETDEEDVYTVKNLYAEEVMQQLRFTISEIGDPDENGWYKAGVLRWKPEKETQTLYIEGDGNWTDAYSYASDGSVVPSWYWYLVDHDDEIKNVKISVSNMGTGSNLFLGCDQLETIDFSGSDLSGTYTLYNAFKDCTSLKKVIWPADSNYDSLSDLDGIFYNCSAMETVSFPEMSQHTFSWIPSEVFYGCTSLREADLSNLKISDAIEDIPDFGSIFENCPNLQKVTIPFEICMDYDVPFGIWSGSDGKIYSPTYLYDVPENITLTKIQSIHAGREICKEKDKYYKKTNLNYAEAEDWCLTANGDLILAGDGVPEANPGWLKYADQIKTAKVYSKSLKSGHQMFSGCTKLTSVDFSGVANTEELTTTAFMFEECISLKSLDLSRFKTSNVLNMQSMFEGCNALTSLNVSGFDTSKVFNTSFMFARCIGLKELDCSKFMLSGLNNGTYMFDECANLVKISAPVRMAQEVALPQVAGMEWKTQGVVVGSVKKGQNSSLVYTRSAVVQPKPPVQPKPQEQQKEEIVETGSHQSDDKTKAVYEVTSTSDGNKTVSYEANTEAKAEKVVVPDAVEINGKSYKVTEIKGGAFKNNNQVTEITIGKNIEIVGKNAFAGCKKLIEVKCDSDKVRTIEEGAFKNCSKLKKVSIGKNVETIGKNAFSGCKALKKATLGTGIKSIGKGAFANCKNLKTLTIKAKNPQKLKITKGAFKGLNKKCVIKVPKKKLKQYKTLLKKAGVSSKIKIKKI